VKDKKATLLAVSFFLFCAALIGGIYFLDAKLVELQKEYDDLEQRKVDLNQTTRFLMDRKTVFSDAFAVLETYKINAAPSNVRFYEDVQQAVQGQNLNLLSTRELGNAPGGRSAMALSVRGDYYSFMQVLADWRNTFTTMRLSAFSVEAPSASDSSGAARGEIEAAVTLEAIVSGSNASESASAARR
jgi:hypothetical protein